MTIQDKQNHTENALARLPDQFIDSTNLRNIISIGSDRFQGLNDDLIKILDGTSLSTSSGKQLDNIATILNLIRISGESDADFRARILTETGSLARSGEVEHVIETYILLSSATKAFYAETYPAGFQITAHKTELENLLKYSEQFGDAIWVKSNITVSDDVIDSPCGSGTGDKIVEDIINGLHYFGQSVSLIDNTVYTVSIYAKAGERDKLLVQHTDKAGVNIRVDFDLTAGQITYEGALVVDSFIELIEDDWYRCSVSYDSRSGGSSTSITWFIELYGSYLGDGVSGLYVCGAQITKTDYLTDYIKATSAPVLFDNSLDETITSAMNSTKAGGVSIILVISPETDYFMFDSSANVDGSGNGTSSAEHGFGSSSDVDGGQLSRVLK